MHQDLFGLLPAQGQMITAHFDFDRVAERRDPDPARAELYDELYRRVYRRLYPALRPLYAEIQRITGYPPPV